VKKGTGKNVVKNIVKAFESWLRQELSQEIYRENTSLQNSRKTLERMVAKVKFNNRLINNLIKNQNLNSMFERFLRDHASEWLEQSKIKDRVSHKEAIEAFLKASASNLPVYLKPQIEVEVL
jgi:cellulose biosynthesis protein BcsQ